jgi:hypothetical protein
MGEDQEGITKKPPDWFARVVAIVGLIFGLGGLGLSYYSYRWQQSIYQEGLQERILVRLGASRLAKSMKKLTLFPNGKLGIEVTNIGLHPIYLKGVTGDFGNEVDLKDGLTARQMLTFYRYDPIEGKKPLKRLEPDETANFVLDINFSQFPVSSDTKLRVRVETTTKTFSQDVPFSWFNISSNVSEWPAPKGKVINPRILLPSPGPK